MSSTPKGPSREFARQAAILALVATLLFWGAYSLDYFARPSTGGERSPLGVVARYFNFDPQSLSDAIASLSGVNVAVFGIVITVVSIIVQLSSERYTGVARMFLRDSVNVFVAAYYVVVCAVSVWLSASLHSSAAPNLTLVLVLCLTTGGLVLMVPYFGYVFWFLEPQHIVARIHEMAAARAKGGAVERDPERRSAAQADVITSTEELTDIANNSIAGRDKIIASAAVNALRDIALDYLASKPQAQAEWFTIGAGIRRNPDFVAMEAESVAALEAGRTWVEWKVMRQMLSIFSEALGSMRDVNYVIAIDTRYIAEAAERANDMELMNLALRFMNSYMRATLTAKDVRTGYNVLNQYRILVETMLRRRRDDAAAAGVEHMKYYGLVAFETGLSFITETVAYDLSAIVQIAHEIGSPVEDRLLDQFLQLDRPPFVREQERALLGVRKAQVKLAAYYLANGQIARARSIAEDMGDEPPERVRAMRTQLEGVERKDFWEIVDRGQNFEFMPPEHRAQLPTFFEWLDRPGSPPRAAT